jgi:hypothetical protein
MLLLMLVAVAPNVLRMAPPPPGKHTLAVEVIFEGRPRVVVTSKLSKAITDEVGRACDSGGYNTAAHIQDWDKE